MTRADVDGRGVGSAGGIRCLYASGLSRTGRVVDVDVRVVVVVILCWDAVCAIVMLS